jgi:phosphoribosyl 1,2-cyclic phosphodiesterase
MSSVDSQLQHARLRFWGVRGSVPAPGAETARYGGNTSCVTLEFSPPGATEGPPALFILDAGTGIRPLGISLMREKRIPLDAHLFLSHTHWDHIQGFPFFAPAFVPGNRIFVHGGAGTDEELAAVLSGQMLHRYFPVSLSQLGSEIRFQHTVPGVHEIAGARIAVAELHHPGSTVGYRFEVGGRSIAYCTDTEPHPDPDGPDGPALPPIDPNVLLLARDADVLIHDAQYTDAEYLAKIGWGHSPVSYAVRTAIAANVARLILFHHDPTRLDADVDVLLEEARAQVRAAGATVIVDAAAEGMEIPLPLAEPVPA